MLFSRLHKDCKPNNLSELQNKQVKSFNAKLERGIYKIIDNKCVCGKQKDILLSEVDRYGFYLKTVLCRSCGLVRSDPYYSEDTLAQFYNHEYRPLYVGNKHCNFDFFLDQINKGGNIFNFLKEFLPSKTEKTKVFEIGCGAGGILKYFQGQGFQVIGADLGNEYIEYGKSQGLSLVYGSQMELTKYGKAHLIIASHVVEHFKNPLKYLLELKELLHDNGIIYIEVPGIKNIPGSYHGDILQYLQNAHAYHFTLKTLTNIMEKAGFGLLKGTDDIRAVYRKKGKGKTRFSDKKEAVSIIRFLILTEIKYRIGYYKMIDFIKNLF